MTSRKHTCSTPGVAFSPAKMLKIAGETVDGRSDSRAKAARRRESSQPGKEALLPYTKPTPGLRQAGRAGAADGTAIGEIEVPSGQI